MRVRASGRQAGGWALFMVSTRMAPRPVSRAGPTLLFLLKSKCSRRWHADRDTGSCFRSDPLLSPEGAAAKVLGWAESSVLNAQSTDA